MYASSEYDCVGGIVDSKLRGVDGMDHVMDQTY